VSVNSAELTISGRGTFATLRMLVGRDEFFAGLYVVGCANGLLGRFLQSAHIDGWMSAALSIDINVIVLFAAFAGISAMLRAEQDELRLADLVVAVIFLGIVALPISPPSWIAVTGLSVYIVVFTNGKSNSLRANDRSDRRRGALILLALTVPMLWSRLLFQFFAKPILNIDASLVSSLLGTDRLGNTIKFADGSGHMVVLPPCSSLANMSLAFLCWISVTQWAEHKWSATDILWSLLACGSVIAVNVSRISIMGMSRGHYEAIHSPWGDLITNSIMLVLMVGVSVMGARREIFSRA